MAVQNAVNCTLPFGSSVEVTVGTGLLPTTQDDTNIALASIKADTGLIKSDVSTELLTLATIEAAINGFRASFQDTGSVDMAATYYANLLGSMYMMVKTLLQELSHLGG